MELLVRYLALFLLFSVINSFGWFLTGNLHNNIQLMVDFLIGSFMAQHFSYYTLKTFLIMLSVILLSMLMILLLTLNVIRHLICANNQNCLLNLNLIYKIYWGKKWLVDVNAGKTQLASFDRSNSGAIDVKMDGSVLDKKSSFRMLPGLTFCSKLDWYSYII